MLRRTLQILEGRSDGPPVSRKTQIALCLALLPMMLLFFRGLGAKDLSNDEAIYAYAAESILETGVWLTPRASISDRPYISKPPLKFWMVAAGVRLGLISPDERGIRTFDAIFSSLALLYIFWIGVRLVDEVAGMGAVFLLVLQPMLMLHHGLRAGTMESILVLQFVSTVYHLIAWSPSEGRRGRVIHILIVAVLQGLAVLAKPTALMVPVALAPMLMIDREWRQRAWRDRWLWLSGIAVATAIIAPWFVAQTLRREAFWEGFIGQGVVQRYQEGLDPSHLRPWTYYGSFLHQELVDSGALPWVMAGALIWLFQVLRRRWTEGVLVLLWVLVPLALLSTSASKLRHYLYPSFPAVALFGGLTLSVLVGVGALLVDRLCKGRFFPSRFSARLGAAMKPHLFVAAAGLSLTIAAVAAVAGSDDFVPVLIWWLGCACLALADPARRGWIATTLVILLALWPWARYPALIERLDKERAPLSAVRECVDELGATVILGPDQKGTLFYIDGISPDILGHPYFYYFHDLDRWQLQAKANPALLSFRLFVEGHQAPTLMTAEAYRAFMEPATLDWAHSAAAKLLVDVLEAGMPAELPDRLAFETPAALRLTRVTVLLLPGPYAICEEPALAAGGLPFDPSS